jgi:PAS domain S-box-containing protein
VDGLVIRYRDITDRRRMEEELKQAEEKYRSIFEYAAHGIFQTTADGRFLSANPAMARMFGYASPIELIEKIDNVGQPLYADPACREEFKRLLRVRPRSLLSAHGIVQGFEAQCWRKDGSLFWVSAHARAVHDPHSALLYYEGTLEDITARKQAEEALRKSERFKASLIAQSPFSIVTYTPDGNITSINHAWEKIWGLTWEQVKHYNMWTDPQLFDTPLRKALERLRQHGGEIPAFELEYV